MTEARPVELQSLEDPFVRAVEETYEKMLGAAVRRRTEPFTAPHDVTAVVGFAGGRKGAIAISFAEDTACRVVSRFGGETIERLGPDVCDGVGELLNIIAGRAKSALGREKGSIDMSLPTVVVGPEHAVHGFKDAPSAQIAFDSELGPFELLVLLERPRARSARVLIADDSRVMRKLLRTGLKDLAPEVVVSEAENGARARQLLAAGDDAFDLVILDLHMPEVSGVEVLEELRRRPDGARLPVLVATSEADAERMCAEACQRAGVTGPLRVLKKPFSPGELVMAARELMQTAVAAGSGGA